MSRVAEATPGFSNITLDAQGSDSSIKLTSQGRIDLQTDDSMLTMTKGEFDLTVGFAPTARINIVNNVSAAIEFSVGGSVIGMTEKSVVLNVGIAPGMATLGVKLDLASQTILLVAGKSEIRLTPTGIVLKAPNLKLQAGLKTLLDTMMLEETTQAVTTRKAAVVQEQS
jgi:hypothetical protein